MKKQLKETLLYLGYSIVMLIVMGIVITYCEYGTEKSAIKIYKEHRLDTISKEEARYWVNYNIGNSSAVKYYLHQMINRAPDTIPSYKEDYSKY